MLNDNTYNYIPFDILDTHIIPKLPNTIIVQLNKYNFNKYHHLIKYSIHDNSYENYIRNMIINDYAFIFGKLLDENFDKWVKMKNYPDTYVVYKNYICFLIHLCIKNTSDKCKNLINTYLMNTGLDKKWHKNNYIKSIRWKI